MKEVTDPSVIAQLEGGQGMREVQDPALIQKLETDQSPSLWESTKNLFTGNNRREYDYPEIPNLVWNKPGQQPTYGNYEGYWPSHDAMAVAGGNPLSQAEIYESNVKGSKVDFDSYGNPYTTYGKNQFYLNRPGLSRADAAQVLPEALWYTLAGKFGGGAGSSVMGKVGQVLGTGAGLYGASVGEDIAAQQVGSNQPVDQQKALLIGALGSGAELAAPHIGRAYNYLKQVFGNKRWVANGTLTGEGRKALESAGMKPEQVTPEWMAEFNKLVRNELDPTTAARVASSKTLPHPVQLTEGQATGNLALQGKEQARLHGVYGDDAQSIMRSYVDDQANALNANAQSLKSTIGGDQVTFKGEGASRAISTLKGNAEATREAVRAGYQGAKQTNAFMPSEAVKDFAYQARKHLSEEGFDLSGAKVAGRLQDVERVIGMKNVNAANVRGMELWRKRIVKDIESIRMSDPSQAEALRQLRGRYDDFIKDSFENALVRGDQTAVQQWQQARQLRATYGQVFEKNRIINKLVKGEHTPEETVNILFGAGRFGSQSKGEVIQALDTIQKQVGPNAWNALREEAFLRLLRNQGDSFSAVKFTNEFDTALREGGTLMRKMFDPAELRLMGQLRDAAKATIYDPRATNPSKTSYALARIASELFGPAGRGTMAVIQRFSVPINESWHAGAARRAPFIPKKPEVTPGIGGGLGGYFGEKLNKYRKER